MLEKTISPEEVNKKEDYLKQAQEMRLKYEEQAGSEDEDEEVDEKVEENEKTPAEWLIHAKSIEVKKEFLEDRMFTIEAYEKAGEIEKVRELALEEVEYLESEKSFNLAARCYEKAGEIEKTKEMYRKDVGLRIGEREYDLAALDYEELARLEDKE
jgi:hypothetical protein